MARITIEADTTTELIALVRGWLNESEPRSDEEKLERAVRRMAVLSRGFVKDVADAVVRGSEMPVDAAFATRHGKQHPGQLGGAIAGAWMAFSKEVGRDVLIHRQTPPRYSMSIDDAQAVLIALKKSQS